MNYKLDNMNKVTAIVCAGLCSIPMAAQPQLNKNNIDEVLKAMTLEEKASLLVGEGWGSAAAGSMTAFDESTVPGAAGTTRAIPRLGIPRTVLADGPAGLRINPTREGDSKTYYCTGFPVGTVMASTWNAPLVQQLTTAMGEEVKEYGVDVLLAPGLNLHRNPLCGRNFEYCSEDPLLTGKIAAAYVNGIQSNGVGVSAKHFAGNNQETNRQKVDTRMSTRALREMYLKGFEIVVKEAHPWTVMSSYNKINGAYTQEDHELLTTILRDEWGYNGIVMTDWIGTRNTKAQVHAQNDLMEPGNEEQIEDIVNAVNDGSLDIADVDRCVRNMLEYIVRTPRFNRYEFSNAPELEAHGELVRKAAAEGLILLKNHASVLPMKDVKNVALYGVGSYDFVAGGTGSGNVNKPYVRNIAEGLETDGFVVDKDIREWYEQYIKFSKIDAKISSTKPFGILLGEAVVGEMNVSRAFIDRKVASTDIAVLTITRNAGEGADRRAIDGDFTLTGRERELLQNISDAYHVAGKKVIVVLNIGGVIETASWKHIPDAILLAWTPGQEGGYTVADVLCGKSYPSGKLPMTFPVSYFDIPSSFDFPYNYTGRTPMNPFTTRKQVEKEMKDVDYVDYNEDIWVGYRYFNTVGKQVSYPFGFGLSYTTFEYSNPIVKVGKDGNVTASITVRNNGSAAGKESVQLYVAAPDGGLVKPAMELKAFAKTRELKPGESEVLSMTIDPYTLASFNESASRWETAAGTYNVKFGASCEDIRANAAFKLAKAMTWDVNRVMEPKVELNIMKVK